MRKVVLGSLTLAALVGGSIAGIALGAVQTTGTNVACATATTPNHVLSVDSNAVDTITGATATQCTTVTYTIPTSTTTVTATPTSSTSSTTTPTSSTTSGTTTTPTTTTSSTTSGTSTGATQSLTGSHVATLNGGKYRLQANEWNSSAAFLVTNDQGLDYKVSTSSINNATNGAPGAYPSLYRGCHWGNCTSNSGLPVQNSVLTTGGKVTTSFAATTVGSGAWDIAYDNWFNPASSTSSNSTGLEMMVWLNKRGPVQPAGSKIATAVPIGGHTYDVWHGGPRPGGTVSYVMNPAVTSVTNLDLGPLAADAVGRGYMTSAWYLIDVEAGSELWQGGSGLTANSFNVCDSAGC